MKTYDCTSKIKRISFIDRPKKFVVGKIKGGQEMKPE